MLPGLGRLRDRRVRVRGDRGRAHAAARAGRNPGPAHPDRQHRQPGDLAYGPAPGGGLAEAVAVPPGRARGRAARDRGAASGRSACVPGEPRRRIDPVQPVRPVPGRGPAGSGRRARSRRGRGPDRRRHGRLCRAVGNPADDLVRRDAAGRARSSGRSISRSFLSSKSRRCCRAARRTCSPPARCSYRPHARPRSWWARCAACGFSGASTSAASGWRCCCCCCSPVRRSSPEVCASRLLLSGGTFRNICTLRHQAAGRVRARLHPVPLPRPCFRPAISRRGAAQPEAERFRPGLPLLRPPFPRSGRRRTGVRHGTHQLT